MIKVVLWFPLVAGVVLAILTFASFAGKYFWPVDILSHLNVQYAIALAVCYIATFVNRRQRVLALVLLPAFAANVYVLAPFFLPVDSARPAGREQLRVVAVNIYFKNDDYDRVIDYLVETDADLVMLSEVQQPFMARLDEVAPDLYPHRHDASFNGTIGLAFLSKHPIVAGATIKMAGDWRQFITAQMAWHGTTVNLFGLHPLPPISPERARMRNREMQMILLRAAQAAGPTIVLGDLNGTPWSWPLRELLNKTRLRHAGYGFGISPTWRLGTDVISTIIDHIIVSPEWSVQSYTRGDDVGSDHYPVEAELSLNTQ